MDQKKDFKSSGSKNNNSQGQKKNQSGGGQGSNSTNFNSDKYAGNMGG